jgi:hypothetical protein
MEFPKSGRGRFVVCVCVYPNVQASGSIHVGLLQQRLLVPEDASSIGDAGL